MTSSYLRFRKSKHAKSKAYHSADHAPQPRKQLDGSRITSPPDDPVNSEETLKRNRKGNS